MRNAQGCTLCNVNAYIYMWRIRARSVADDDNDVIKRAVIVCGARVRCRL